MDNTKVFKMSFASVYPMYIQKAEKKGRTKAEVDAVIFWLTGYDDETLQEQINKIVDNEHFYNPSNSKRRISSLGGLFVQCNLFTSQCRATASRNNSTKSQAKGATTQITRTY